MGNSEWTPGGDLSLGGEASRLRRENERLRDALKRAWEMADNRAPDIHALRGFLKRAVQS